MIERQITLDDSLDLCQTDLAIGFFDGLHLGHKALLSHCRKDSSSPSLLTFSPEDMSLFRKDGRILYTREERNLLFQENGIQAIYVLPFDEKTRLSSPEHFLAFLKRLNPRRILVGEDFTFGCFGKGKAEDIRSYFADSDVLVLPLDKDERGKISTTRIKDLLEQGDLKEANRLLGTDYFLLGQVIPGKHNGHLLGFPTANVAMSAIKVYPPIGVYKTITCIEGKSYPSMTNIGTHPTLQEIDHAIVETHIHGLDEELYSKTIRVFFLEKIRDQKRFSSKEKLIAQLQKDLQRVLA